MARSQTRAPPRPVRRRLIVVHLVGWARLETRASGKVTRIAAPDAFGRINGTPIEQPGFVDCAMRPLGLCGGMTDATFVTTTEVYPGGSTTADECVQAQMATISAGIEFFKNMKP